MTTTIRSFGLGGWIRCAAVAMSIVLCAAAFGDPSNKVAAPKQKQGKKMCYTYISNSAIAQPCDRLGPIPTTVAPMTIIGNTKGENVR